MGLKSNFLLIFVYFVQHLLYLLMFSFNASIYGDQYHNSTSILSQGMKSETGSFPVFIYIVLNFILLVYTVMYSLALFSNFERKCCEKAFEEDKNKNKTEKEKEAEGLIFCILLIIYAAIKITHVIFAISKVLLDFITFQECCWKTNYKLRLILNFIGTMCFYLYLLGVNCAIVNTFLVTSITKTDTDKIDLILAIIALVFCVLLIAWEIFYFLFFSMYVPKSLRDLKCCQFACNLKKNSVSSDSLKFGNGFARFMRKSEINTSFCILGSVCGSTNLEHILRCHSDLHIPTRKCNPNYCCTCRKNYLIGFHQTDPQYVRGIALNGMQCGKKGMFGGGIYFARSIDHTFGKAHNEGAFIVALVDMGKMQTLSLRKPEITLGTLNQNGYDSVYAEAGADLSRDEFIVYETERVKQWIICY